MLCSTGPFFGMALNLPVSSAEFCRQQAERVLKTRLSFVERALGTASGKDLSVSLLYGTTGFLRGKCFPLETPRHVF